LNYGELLAVYGRNANLGKPRQAMLLFSPLIPLFNAFIDAEQYS